jgi:hypothetical protein
MRWITACLLPVLTQLQAAQDGARLYRDMKPNNIASDPSIGLFAFIDLRAARTARATTGSQTCTLPLKWRS